MLKKLEKVHDDGPAHPMNSPKLTELKSEKGHYPLLGPKSYTQGPNLKIDPLWNQCHQCHQKGRISASLSSLKRKPMYRDRYRESAEVSSIFRNWFSRYFPVYVFNLSISIPISLIGFEEGGECIGVGVSVFQEWFRIQWQFC